MNNKILELESSARQEFSDASDYIWKSLHFVEHETKLEKNKLIEYFQNDEESAKLRWQLESKKLNNVFPYHISVGNLFSIMSLFESYLFMLSKEIEKETGTRVSLASRRGISGILGYFKSVGVDILTLDLYDQITAAIKIRNCLSHANGILSRSENDELEIKRIQKSGVYLLKKYRDKRKSKGEKFDEVYLVNSEFGRNQGVSQLDYLGIPLYPMK